MNTLKIIQKRLYKFVDWPSFWVIMLPNKDQKLSSGQ